MKPRDHNVFGLNQIDESYQRNPLKIGYQSLSPPNRSHLAGSYHLHPAGIRKRSPTANAQDQRATLRNGGGGVSDIQVLEQNLALMSKDKQAVRIEQVALPSGQTAVALEPTNHYISLL